MSLNFEGLDLNFFFFLFIWGYFSQKRVFFNVLKGEGVCTNMSVILTPFNQTNFLLKKVR